MATLKLYTKTTTVTPATLELFLQYANDASNWNGNPLVGGNCPGDFAALGRISHMKMAGLVVTNATNDKINGKKAKHTWMYFTEAGRALAASYGVDPTSLCLTANATKPAAKPTPAERVAVISPASVAADVAPIALSRFSVCAVKTFTGMEGMGFNADLYVDGVKVAQVIDDASGGPINYNWTTTTAELNTLAVVDSLPHKACPTDAEDWERDLYIDGFRKQDLDDISSGLVDDAVIEKQLARYRRTDVLYTTPECKDGEFYRVKHGGDVEGEKARILAKTPNAKFI